MRRLTLLPLLLLSISMMAQNVPMSGYCTKGGAFSKTQGLNSTNYSQIIIPSCTVTVYITNTATLATIFSDVVGTPLANPFTATSASSINPGYWIAYASPNLGYDIVLSGGVSPNTYSTPITLKSYTVAQGPIVSCSGSSSCTFGGQIISTVTTGTSPLSISSTTLNTNLNADLLDSHHATDFMTVAAPASAATFVSTVGSGTPPMTCASPTTMTGCTAASAISVSNLNTASPIVSSYSIGAPFTLASSFVTTNLNADLVDGKHAAYFTNKICQIDIDGTGTAGVIQATDTHVWECINPLGSTIAITAVSCYRDLGATTINFTSIYPILNAACSPTNGTLGACVLNSTNPPTVPANGAIQVNLGTPDGVTTTIHCSFLGTF